MTELKIEQRQFRKTALITASQWLKMGDHPAVVMKDDQPWIETLEGGHIVTSGDWIATGVKGEHWPIKPDVFAATYEPAEQSLRPTAPDAVREAIKAARQQGFDEAIERAAEECDTRNLSAKAWKAHTAKGEPDWYRFDGAEQESANIAQAIRALGDE